MLHRSQSSTPGQKTDKEVTEERDKRPESYDVKITSEVKITFDIRGLIHIHAEDTWKGAI